MLEKNISEDKIRTVLIYTILELVITTILLLVSVIYLPIVYGALIITIALVFMILGVISLVFYFINPEIMYGIWISIGGTRRIKKYNNQNVRIGRKILLVFMIGTICIVSILMFMVFPRL